MTREQTNNVLIVDGASTDEHLTNTFSDVVAGFGDEWTRFDQSRVSHRDAEEMFLSYFRIFPWERLPKNAVGMDVGCGSGRWAKLVAPRVGTLHCIDASPAALAVARRNLADRRNCEFHLASASAIPLPDNSLDFGYSLGVLHHVPDTQAALAACVTKLKRGAPFLLYLYYRFDNRPSWFRALWRLSEIFRYAISRAPHPFRYALSQLLAVLLYWPLSRTARLLEALGVNVDTFPLSAYRHRQFYVLRTDALDRFGTRVEKRFTRIEIKKMMQDAGIEQVVFSDRQPYWCAVGVKA